MRRAICTVILVATPLLGGLKLQLRGGRPIVDGVYVNGHGPYRFLLDTATQLNHIDPKLARSIGLKATIRADVVSASAVTEAPAAEGVDVAVDTVTAGGQTFVLSGLETVRQLGRNIQGVLGQEFLSQFDYLLDLRGKRLEFGKQERPGTRAEFQLVHGRPAVSTSLGWLLLDSGTAWVVLFGVEPVHPTNYIWTLAGSSAVGTMLGKPLIIEGRNIRHGEILAVSGRNEVGVAGLLPASLFNTIYICNSEGYIVFD